MSALAKPLRPIPPGVRRYAAGETYKEDFRLVDWAVNGLHVWPYDQARDWHEAFHAKASDRQKAILGLCDRFYLLTRLLRRPDALHPWVYARCREVEADPDGYLDLWARGHFKSSLLTFAGGFQEALRNPDLTIAVFSHTRPIAKGFLRQIKTECEQNEELKAAYPDVLWLDPRKDAPKWSEDDGIVFQRRSNPKEQTFEAWGLVDGQPTSKHFGLRIYDDVVTRESVTTPEMVKKTTEARELSDNLKSTDGREWNVGTRYHFADTYQTYLDRGVLKPRVYPATDNGLLSGKPVFLTPEQWEDTKRRQPTQVAAQMLQNPAAGNDTMFEPGWLKGYEVRPHTLNVYILVDPSKGPSKNLRSDRTAMAVIGLDAQLNKYLLDGFRHRMNLAERWEALRNLHRRWSAAPGVTTVRVGYERYGMQSDLEHFEAEMQRTKYAFPIDEVAWPRQGGASKEDRVGRLVPDHKNGHFYLPAVVWRDNKAMTWKVEDGKIVYSPLDGETKLQATVRTQGQPYRIAQPIKRVDEEKQVYDLTAAYIEEYLFFPFAAKDDLLDGASRIYDMEPAAPLIVDERTLEPGVYPDS